MKELVNQKGDGTTDGTWELGEQIPTGITPDTVNRGRTFIDSHLFDVSDDEKELTSGTTSKKFEIKTVRYNKVDDDGNIVSNNTRKIAVLNLMRGHPSKTMGL